MVRSPQMRLLRTLGGGGGGGGGGAIRAFSEVPLLDLKDDDQPLLTPRLHRPVSDVPAILMPGNSSVVIAGPMQLFNGVLTPFTTWGNDMTHLLVISMTTHAVIQCGRYFYFACDTLGSGGVVPLYNCKKEMVIDGELGLLLSGSAWESTGAAQDFKTLWQKSNQQSAAVVLDKLRWVYEEWCNRQCQTLGFGLTVVDTRIHSRGSAKGRIIHLKFRGTRGKIIVPLRNRPFSAGSGSPFVQTWFKLNLKDGHPRDGKQAREMLEEAVKYAIKGDPSSGCYVRMFDSETGDFPSSTNGMSPSWIKANGISRTSWYRSERLKSHELEKPYLFQF